MEDGSVDTLVSTYMMNKRKDPAKTFAKAMRLLKDDGAFVFVEPLRGEGLLGGIREYFGRIHKATNAFGNPGLDFKGIVERWAEGPGRDEKMDVEVDVEERNFFLDPHMWGGKSTNLLTYLSTYLPTYLPTYSHLQEKPKGGGL